MSEAEQDVLLGRLLRERKEAEVTLVLLQAKAQRIGQTWESVGRTLQRDPTALNFPHESVSTRFQVGKVVEFPVATLEEIHEVVNAVREQQLKVWELADAVKRIGY